MASTNRSFFIPGDCQDQAYINVRDNLLTANKLLYPGQPEPRMFIESLWNRYRDLADPHFREDARNHFLERFWEMYLAVTLRERGFQLTRVDDEGPEFYFLHKDRKVWVEAVAPGPGNEEDKVPGLFYGEVQEVPTEKILLRFTNALYNKRNQYYKALFKKIIEPNDIYLLAINSRRIPHAPYGNTVPFFVQAFLPFGNLACVMDTKTGNTVETFYQHREKVLKTSGATVPTNAFLNHEFSFISAILHSAVDCVNHPDILGDDFSILHNPTATHPFDRSLFNWCDQIFYQDGRLELRGRYNQYAEF
jgi:hypothetical protein